jgi:hypothetical protein
LNLYEYNKRYTKNNNTHIKYIKTLMPDYVCVTCDKQFERKNDYDRHKNKQTPCISLEAFNIILKEKKC